MSDQRSIETVIKQARSRVIQKATGAKQKFDLPAKIDWQNRRLFLDELIREFRGQRLGRAPAKSVFISYSVHSGIFYFEFIKERLRNIGFEVLTGFQRSEGDKGNVLARVLGQIQRSTVYLGLLTKEMRVSGPQGEEQWSPSVWTMEEKGMALALGKPFVLLVEKGIYADYWLKTAPERVHHEFTDDNFQQQADEVVSTVLDRYEELAIGYLGQGEARPMLNRILAHQESED